MSAPQLVRGAPRALHRALAVAAVNRHDVREREPLLHYRNAEQLDLRDGADVVAKVGEEHRRIEVALVIGDEDVGLIAVEAFKPRNVHAPPRRPHVTPAPELRRREDEIFDAEKPPQDVADGDGRNAYENQQQKRDEECPVVSNHIAREWGVGSGEWGKNAGLSNSFFFPTPHSPLPTPYSNNSPVSDRRAFGDYDDALADVVVVAVEMLAPGLVKDADVRSYPHVLIDDGFANDGVFADAYPGQPALAVVGQFGQRLVIIGAHHERVFEARHALDARADADDGMDDRSPIEDAAVGDQRIPDFAVGEFGAGQITRVGVNRRVGVEQVEFRHHRGEVEIGVVKRADGSDVFPVTVDQISLHVVHADGRREGLAAEILVLLVFE